MSVEIAQTKSSRPVELNKPHATIHLGDYLQMDEIQLHFEQVPLDPYVTGGFRYKSIARVHVEHQCVTPGPHGPLFQPRQYNPVHGDIVRHYTEIDPRLVALLKPIIQIFAACARLRPEHEILVQAQRVTATSGENGALGFPVVEGWHQDNTKVLGIFLVNRVNVSGGISMLALDRSGADLAFAQTLGIGDLLLIDDTQMWHNTTPISKVRPRSPAYRDIVILTCPSCREPACVCPSAAQVA